MSQEIKLYRPVVAGDAEGTAIAVAYEIWRAQLSVEVLLQGPGAIRTGKAGEVEEFTLRVAREVGYLASLLLQHMREGKSY